MGLSHSQAGSPATKLEDRPTLRPNSEGLQKMPQETHLQKEYFKRGWWCDDNIRELNTGGGGGYYFRSLAGVLSIPCAARQGCHDLALWGKKRFSLVKAAAVKVYREADQDLNPEPCAPKPMCTPDTGLTVVEMNGASGWGSSSLERLHRLWRSWVCFEMALSKLRGSQERANSGAQGKSWDA